MNNELTLAIAKEITCIDDIELLCDIHNYFVLEKNDFDVPVEIGDIMAIEALYKYLNEMPLIKIELTHEHQMYYFSVQTGDVIPVFVPKNGDEIFCEF